MPEQWRTSKRVKQSPHHNPTPAEERLWSALRGNRVDGLYFRRQYPAGRFILDFYCVECRLAVEVDGAAHPLTSDQDLARQEWLEANGYRVIRFSNSDVMSNLDGVVEAIRQAADEQSGAGQSE